MRTLRTLFLFSILFAANTLHSQMIIGPDTLVGNEWIRYGQPYYKCQVTEDGIYRISGNTLQDAGIDLQSVTGDQIRLYSFGQQVPIHVSTDDMFGPQDYIEFLGKKQRSEFDRFLYHNPDRDMLNPEYSLYTNARPYFLTFSGSDQPLRVETIQNDISNPPLPIPYYLHEEKRIYHNAHHDPYERASDGTAVSYSSYMHGEGFGKEPENTHTTVLPSTEVFIEGHHAQLHIRFTSANLVLHQFHLLFNGQEIANFVFRDLKLIDTTISIPNTQLLAENQIQITSDEVLSRISVATVSLTYPRLPVTSFTPVQHLGIAESGDVYVDVQSFSHLGAEHIVYSEDGSVRQFPSVSEPNHLRFFWTADQRQLSVYPVDAIRPVDFLRPVQFTDWTQDQTEFVLISHPEILQAGSDNAYCIYRRSEEGGNYTATTYSILDIYDQFGYGVERHPQAVRNFVEFGSRHWNGLKMFLIVGRGIEYPRSRIEDGTWENSFFVPTFGKPGSDNLLMATPWDLVSRYPVGRLAVTRSAEVDMYLQKVKEYDAAPLSAHTLENKAWMKNVIHIAGGKDATEQYGFQNTLNALADIIAASDFGANTYHFQKESTEIIGESQSKQVEKLLHEGSSIINYLGHSSTSLFEFTIQDPTQWGNKGRYPVFSAMGCSAGQIFLPIQSLSDRYVLIPDQGAIAFISGSGSQFPVALVSWARPWYEYIGTYHYGATLGESNLFALRNVGYFIDFNLYYNNNAYRYLLEQQTLQGDPAIRINPLPGPDYTIESASLRLNPSFLNTRTDSFTLDFSIINVGRNLRQLVSFEVNVVDEAGASVFYLEGAIQVDSHRISQSLTLPVWDDARPGIYRLHIRIDGENVIAELPLPEAEENNDLIDNAGTKGVLLLVVDDVVTAIHPPEFAIVNAAVPEMIASSSNAFSGEFDLIIEMDTTSLMNSPSLLRASYPAHSGALKWSPDITWVPGQEYFWRVSTDSLSPENGYRWSQRSFLYDPALPSGWNQSHFLQLTENELTQITADTSRRQFDFAKTFTNFRVLNRFHDVPAGLVPYFFEDGVFIARLAQSFRNIDVQGFVVAIDPDSGQYLNNPPGGLYGSTGLSLDMPGFAYHLLTPESRQNMINLIENVIPDGHYVFFYTYQHTGFEKYHPETWAADEQTHGKSIFSVIEAQFPQSNIRQLEQRGDVPYIVLFQKGVGGIEEQIGADTADIISVSFDAGSFFDQGAHTSTLVGPAKKWGAIEQLLLHPLDSNASSTLQAYALNAALSDTFWISTDLKELYTDIQDIDASQYPYLRLRLHTMDPVKYNPVQPDYWRVYYEGYPDLLLNGANGFAFNKDTLQQGEILKLDCMVENLSNESFDTVDVSMTLIDEQNQRTELRSRIFSLDAASSLPVSFSHNTKLLSGNYQVVVDVNPDRLIRENTYVNNIGLLHTWIEGDRTNPILDVTFDGSRIHHGDLVAARPIIEIRLFDQNELLRLQDTSLFRVFLQYPGEFDMRPVYFSSAEMSFYPAPDEGENTAVIHFTPNLLLDGMYHLRVEARDPSDNPSGTNDYFIGFLVDQRRGVSHAYNFPNPFSHSTQFGYTLTGDQVPADYRIEIVSPAGIAVRTISKTELGALYVGKHQMPYVWEGRDDAGHLLPGGVYFYKLVVEDETGAPYPMLTEGEESIFHNGWGKLIIVR